tara:strand:+ start:654 stop:866 length:213 start_codon:yes stop_codon:yes gene_type:complete
MSIIGSNWKDEEPYVEEVRQFQDITGENFYGSKKDLEKRINKIKNSNCVSRKERRDLINLNQYLNQKKDE